MVPSIRLRKRAEEIVDRSAGIAIPYRANTCGKIAPMCCGPMAEFSSPADRCRKAMMVVLF
jgi:hypothetical protein